MEGRGPATSHLCKACGGWELHGIPSVFLVKRVENTSLLLFCLALGPRSEAAQSCGDHWWERTETLEKIVGSLALFSFALFWVRHTWHGV